MSSDEVFFAFLSTWPGAMLGLAALATFAFIFWVSFR